LHADPARGGAEGYTVDLAAGLRGRGHEVSLIASSFAPGGKGESDVLLPARGATRLRKYLHFLDALEEHLSGGAKAIVHAMLPVRRCDIYHPHAGIAAAAVKHGHRKYSSAIARSAALLANRTNLKRRKFAALERELLESSFPPVVLCLSEYVKREIAGHYSLAPDRLVTLFNAVDLAKFDPSLRPEAGQNIRTRFGIGAEKVVALMIAQDFQRKGLREAILALSRVRDPRLVLLVVGKEKTGAYENLAREQGIDKQVIFAGRTDDPYAFYRAADSFVLPTRHDPCSLVVLEALAMGLPVISTVFNGACEIMTDGRHGFVLRDPTDVNAIAKAMRDLLNDHNRREMSEACSALRGSLAYDHHLDRLTTVYQSVLARR